MAAVCVNVGLADNDDVYDEINEHQLSWSAYELTADIDWDHIQAK